MSLDNIDLLDEYAAKLRAFGLHKKNITVIQDEVLAMGVQGRYSDIANNAIAIIEEGIFCAMSEQIIRDMQKHKQ